MPEEKSPYGKFSIEQVARAEAFTFIIQIGKELYSEGEFYAFTKDRIDYHAHVILTKLRDMIKNGSQEEKTDALRNIWNFRILPLRIH